MADGINLIQDCFRDSFHPSRMMINYDNGRAYELTISPTEQSTVSPMINQDNIEFLIKHGFRVNNIWSECDKGLKVALYQVFKPTEKK